MHIFVGGSLRGAQDPDALRQFVAALGRFVVERGHVLLNGCRNPVDKEIAEGAYRWLVASDRDPKRFLVSYWQRDVARAHDLGLVRASALADWKMSHPELRCPEQIDNADVTVFVAGGEGTYLARNWAHWGRKTIIGVPRFGGAGEQIYLQELRRLENDPARSEQYEQINEVGNALSDYAVQLVVLAERLLVPATVFAIMSYKHEWRDVYTSFGEICRRHGFDVERTDDAKSLDRINPRIERGIETSAFVIADLSEPSPNVFYEIGFAFGGGKRVILTAQRGTLLPFDLADLPVLFWDSQQELQDGLDRRIAALKPTLHRRAGG
jgi:hypothetical protein